MVAAFVLSPPILFPHSLLVRKHHPTAPSFPPTSGENKHSIMQLYAILLLTANLAVSVIAAPVANTTNVTSSSSGPSAAGFLSGTNHGDGGSINHSIHLGDIRFQRVAVVILGTFYAPALGACGIESDDTQLIAAVSHDLFDNYP